MRINGWARIGIVASLLWMPLGAVYGCRLGFAGNCGSDEMHLLIGFYALAPVVAGWIAVLMAVCAVRWIWRGFVR